MSGLSWMYETYQSSIIALYGLGTETRQVIRQLGNDFEIAGLLDGYRTGGRLYEKDIISLEQALDMGVKLILVVARPGSCRAIARRIGKICQENQVALMDIRGNNLCEIKKVSYCFPDQKECGKSWLLKQAETYDVISVDLFDTLVMRQTMFPEDVPEIAQYRWQEKGVRIENLCGRRLESEKALSASSAPSLTQIYERAIADFASLGVTPEELAQMEWSVDYDLLVPRREMCRVISELYRQGREVYIVSDTYYTKEQIEQILEKCGIDFVTDCILSCCHHTGKKQRLFEVLKEKTGGKTCVHIGDDPDADIAAAQRNHIASLRVYSGAQLMEQTGYLGLWDSMESLSDRIRGGMFTSVLFNSPFRPEEGGEKICVRRADETGYLFFAPVITDFVLWSDRQITEYGIQNVWFTARDGYLIRKLYDSWKPDRYPVYFLTSRIAAIRAGVETEADIRSVGEMKYSGTLRQQLRERFGITAECECNDTSQTLEDFTAQILEKAKSCRKNYKKYIDGLPVREGTVAFIDFVAKGTSQMYLSRLTSHPLKGFYFLRLEEEYMRKTGLDIVPFYENEEKADSVMFERYYMLETVLTSPEAMVTGFDEQGAPCYAKETRRKKDISCLLRVQRGIERYFHTYTKLCPREVMHINKKLDEAILSLPGAVTILDGDFLNLKVEDPFFNRTTDLTDLF